MWVGSVVKLFATMLHFGRFTQAFDQSLGGGKKLITVMLIYRHWVIMSYSEIVSEYDQKIPQSQTSDKPMTPRGRATQQLRDTSKQLFIPYYSFEEN